LGGQILKKISSVTPYLFENHLIISLSKDWINVFKGIPEFDVYLDEGKKLHIVQKGGDKK